MPPGCCRRGSGSPNVERVGWSVSTVPPNGSARRPTARRGSVCARSCVASRRDGPGGGGVARPRLHGGRLAGEQQADPAPVARGRTAGAVPETEEAAPRGLGTAVGAMCPIAPNALWALDFQFDTTVDDRTLEAVEHRRRVHPRMPRHRGRAFHRRRPGRRHPRPARPRTRRTRVRAFRQRPRVHRARGRRLVSLQRRRFGLHRPRLTVAERLDRVVQRPAPRRAAQRLALRQPARSPSDHRGLAHRLQHQPTPLRPRRPHPERVRPGLDHQHQPALA